MKLSYTIRNWPDRDWAQLCAAALDANLNGLEIKKEKNPVLTARNSPNPHGSNPSL